MDRLLEVNPEAGKKLYNLLFHYSHYTEKWACFRNEDKEHYFNGSNSIYPIGLGETIKEAYDNYCSKPSLNKVNKEKQKEIDILNQQMKWDERD